MSNFFLLNEAIENNAFNIFKDKVSELISIDKSIDDIFYRHDSFWSLDILSKLYSNLAGFDEKAIYMFFEQLSPSQYYFENETEIDSFFVGEANAFLGTDFSKTIIHSDNQIINSLSYLNFSNKNLWNVNFRNFWNKKDKLFPELIMCGEVNRQISQIGNSGYFNQIIDKLKEFNDAIANWTTGNFSYKDINNNYALRISPESAQTMNIYKNQRVFQLPNGSSDCFELHIKTGDLRFHFLPDNVNRKVYIGYIGPHLQIVSG